MASSTSTTKKRKCQFNQQLQKEFPYLQPSRTAGESSVVCTICNSVFSIGSGGRTSVKEHEGREKHKAALRKRASSHSVANFFRKVQPSDEEYRLAVHEGTFAFHTIRHNQSFRSMDCTSRLLKDVGSKKFSCARTKCEAIVTNVFAPWAKQELLSDLQAIDFVSVSIDVSNHNTTKLLPLLVRYFQVEAAEPMQNKLLDFVDIPGETAEIVSQQVLQCLKNYDLDKKVVALSADNTNTNFGGLLRRGKENVLTKLKNSLQREIIGLGCGAHIIHNCAQTALDTIPIDLEGFVQKVCRYFHTYTVRVERLKDFCDFVGENYQTILGYSNVRWLSMMPALERILKIFQSLKSFFLYEKQCPIVLRKAFEAPETELWLCFAHAQMALFHESIQKIEGNEITAIDGCLIFKDLVKKLTARKDEGFVPLLVRPLLRQLDLQENVEITRQSFSSVSDTFFLTAIDYLNAWSQHTDDLRNLQCILLRSVPERDEFEKAVNMLTTKCSIFEVNMDELFDELTYLREFTAQKMPSWGESSVTYKWIQVFSHFKNKFLSYKNLKKLVEISMSLPGSNASVERLFSQMNMLWTPEKSQMKVETARAVLSVKVNFNMSCPEFMTKVSKDKSILRKICSEEKYYNH